MTKKTVKLKNGETYAYSEEGSGEALILVHGNMSSSVHFSPIISRLAENFRVIAPDLRGFGDSSYNKNFNSLNELADDVKLFAEALGIECARYAGWSAGGGVVFCLAAKYPEAVKSIFIIEGTSHRGYPIYKKDEKGAMLIGQAYASKEEMSADPVQVAPMLAVLATGNTAGMEWVWGQTIYTAAKPDPEQSALWLSETMKQRCLADLDWALANLNMGGVHNGYAEGDNSVAKINCPCALTTCGKDIVVPEAMVRDNAAFIKGAKVLTYPEAGHSPLADCPEVLTADMIKFFTEN